MHWQPASGHNILIVTDVWEPQVSGTVSVLKNLRRELIEKGHNVKILNPTDCRGTHKLIGHPTVEWGIPTTGTVRKWCNWAHNIHIDSPEGPIGLRTMWHCFWNRIPYTTSYNIRWPQRMPIPTVISKALLRFLHSRSKNVLVNSEELRQDLINDKFKNVNVWEHGVDRNVFNASNRQAVFCGKPLLICVSRITDDKNIEAFCQMQPLSARSTRVVIGEGPCREALQKKFPNIIFTGALYGAELAEWYANADCLVFPTKTETTGVAMMESMSCGTPVAAYPTDVTSNILSEGVTGCMHKNLRTAIQRALQLDRSIIDQNSRKWCSQSGADQFLDHLTYH